MPKTFDTSQKSTPQLGSGVLFSIDSTKQPEWLHVGTLSQPHGLRGEMKVKLNTAEASNLQSYGVFQTLRGGKTETPLTLTHLRGSSTAPIATFTEIPDRTTAEQSKGLQLYIHESQLPQLPDDEIYQKDMLDMPVILHGVEIGHVHDLMFNGAQDVLEIKTLAHKYVLVPWVDAYVETVSDISVTLTDDAEGFFEI